MRSFQVPYVPEPIRKLKRHLFRRSDGERILVERFNRIHGSDPGNPRTFTEKLYRRMIDVNRIGNPVLTRLADKCLAREHVAEVIGAEHLVPLIWSGPDPLKIPFNKLPKLCIAKTNHGSGNIVKLYAPHDPHTIGTVLQRWLDQNHYWSQREFQYFDIKPLAMIEECLDDGEREGPLDYRFWCFSGRVEAIQVDNHAHDMNVFYMSSWERTDCTYRKRDQRGQAPGHAGRNDFRC